MGKTFLFVLIALLAIVNGREKTSARSYRKHSEVPIRVDLSKTQAIRENVFHQDLPRPRMPQPNLSHEKNLARSHHKPPQYRIPEFFDLSRTESLSHEILGNTLPRFSRPKPLPKKNLAKSRPMSPMPKMNNKSNKKVVCYYTNWSQYRQRPASFFPEDVDPFMCTHIIYAFAKLNGQSILEEFEWNDPTTEWSKGMYERMLYNKEKNPNLKILLAVGGWNLGAEPFSKMVHDRQLRRIFVATTVEFLLRNKFDGLDLDWEYPGSRKGSQEDDKELFTVLIKELKANFEPHGLLLTAAVGVGMETVEAGYEIKEISKYLDFINLMTYDLHGSWESTLGHNAPLSAKPSADEKDLTLNIEFVIDHWLCQGAPKEKLMLGMATYGRSFRLGKKSRNKPGDVAVGPGSHGKYSGEAGFLTYYEICQNLNENNWYLQYDDVQQVPYTFKENNWVSFDNPKSIKLKTEYLLKKDLGGAMFWSLDSDDFTGDFCGQGKYPLLKTVLGVLNGDNTIVQMKTYTPTPDHEIVINEHKTTKKSKNRLTESESNSICPDGDGFYVNYESGCKEYHVCVFTGTEFANAQYLTCPMGLAFDITLKACNFADMVSCKKRKTKHLKPIENSSKTDSCPADGFYMVENSNCEKYYLCAFSKTDFEVTYDYTCKTGTKFNEKTQKCDENTTCKTNTVITTSASTIKPHTTKESKQKTGICSNGDGIYPDKSTDCKFYVKCLFTGTRFERQIRTECPTGLYFNDETKECTSKSKC